MPVSYRLGKMGFVNICIKMVVTMVTDTRGAVNLIG